MTVSEPISLDNDVPMVHYISILNGGYMATTLKQIRNYMAVNAQSCSTATELAEDVFATFPDYQNEEAVFDTAQEIFYDGKN